MNVRFVTQKIHAFLDYPVALSLIAMPFVLGLGESSALAFWLSVVTGVAALVLTLLTDHETGAIRVIPYSAHLSVDFLVGVVFIVAPLIWNFTGIDMLYYLANAAAVLTVVSLHRPEQSMSIAAA